MLLLSLTFCPPVSGKSTPPEPAESPTENVVEPIDSAEELDEASDEASDDASEDPASPSIRVSGSVWRSKPGIIFLQTPIGLLSLSSKTGLRDVKGSHKITLFVEGSNTAVDIRDRSSGSLVRRYLSGTPRYDSPDKKQVLLWTPEGEQAFTLGSHRNKMSGDPQKVVTFEVSEAGAVKGVHDLQVDLQISQPPKSKSDTRMRLSGTVSKLKSSFVFLKTPLGIVTVSTKTGVRNAKVGQDMTVWVDGDHVAIDLYQAGTDSEPSRRFLTGRLVWDSPDRSSVRLWTPDGEKTFPAESPRKGPPLKEGVPITLELDQQGDVVEIRRLN